RIETSDVEEGVRDVSIPAPASRTGAYGALTLATP
ncbi:MAG: hypothetical protein QOJ96_2020, partial [Alphaproteobacteria bacterium]|nr:hypothetical protein [Alphaproteobacteria bacterium]